MKKYVSLFICLILTIMVFGQSKTKAPIANNQKAEITTPKFTGAINAVSNVDADNSSRLKIYIKENIDCPVTVADCRIEGTEIVRFTVSTEGDVSNFNIINSVCKDLDKEVIRVLKGTKGMWIPGNTNEVPSEMEYEVSLMIADCKEGTYSSYFVGQAQKYFKLGGTSLLVENKPKKAMRFYNKGLQYLPNNAALLSLRGLCYYELGDKESARKDWNKVSSLGGINPVEIAFKIDNMSGYSEMINILAKN